ncbi:hypothetical protein TSL6_02140 [Sulfurovum sp. TSL6]|uniref:hypothetical protein n=1 Tax=Sulfurovum sp. TSL6 TaxID=2826995 RepID=UPI001CC6BDC1|nr:hypothetical protein [Sulfurovum sp. TSL6]GIT99707.1 hypothetical protein TSL6_02140 [Sulfurovum sp. TSL6]
MDDSELHHIAKKEVESKTYDKDIWNKALALTGGNDTKAKEKYIKLRILQLKRDGYKPKKSSVNQNTESPKKSTHEPKEEPESKQNSSQSSISNLEQRHNKKPSDKKTSYGWILWVIAVVFIFALVYNNKNTTKNSSYSKSNNYSSNYTSRKQDNYVESKPSVSEYTLSKNELLYCEAEMIRLDVVKDKIDKYSQYEIDKYNGLSDDYNVRCANKKYYQNDMYSINKLIKNRKYEIEQEGLARFQKNTQKIKSTFEDGEALYINTSPVSGDCKVTIFNDGSIGATLNGKFKQWKTMSSWERKKCKEALKEEQVRVGYTKEERKKVKETIEKYPLTIIANPLDARVQIMNIKPKYYHGIRLVKGKYKIRISKKGYVTQNHIFDPSKYSTYNVMLKKRTNNKSSDRSTVDCKVTIFNDGSIGASIGNGAFNTWKSMSAQERKECEKALKKEQSRVGRKGNIYEAKTSDEGSQALNCKVTIFNDGSIGASIGNGAFNTWKSMSAQERKECEKALNIEQERIGRKGNTHKINTNNSKKKRTDKYPLTIETFPSDARVQIMNIKPKYYDGIRLVKGEYKIRVSKKGYTTQNSIADPAEKTTYQIILKKKKNNISYSEKIRNKSYSNNGLPANAKLDYYGHGWECKKGYYKYGNKCNKVAIPANAKLDYYGHDWECRKGYYKYANKCNKVAIPANAKLDYYGHDWECKKGYYKYGNKCNKVAIPANAKLDYYGHDWECRKGYYKYANKCNKVAIPANAKLDYYGHDWECKKGYYKYANKCNKVAIPANAKLDYYGHDWECRKGYYKYANKCLPVGQ